jgi:uncharacterized membrane protein
MRWVKIAAILVGVFLAYLAVSMIIGFLIEAAVVALVVAVIVLAVKVAFYRKQVSSSRSRSEVREPGYSSSLPRDHMRDLEEEIARLKREMGS